MSTDIKFYFSTNNNAPQLQNTYGSMIGVLDACLVNGISLGLVSTLTAMGTTVTAVFSNAHNLMQYQVLKITGANQAEYNGEHRILTVPNATSVTFQLATAPSATTASNNNTATKTRQTILTRRTFTSLPILFQLLRINNIDQFIYIINNIDLVISIYTVVL